MSMKFSQQFNLMTLKTPKQGLFLKQSLQWLKEGKNEKKLYKNYIFKCTMVNAFAKNI